MWKVVFDSVPGTSHAESGIPCQDACRIKEVTNSDEVFLISVCADGAGSAEYSEVGATIACDSLIELADQAVRCSKIHSGFTKSTAIEWCEEIRGVLRERAVELNVPLRELACTLLAAIVGESTSVFLQIGDGAIVIDGTHEYEPVFWPQSGEYANTTNFLTDQGFEEAMEVCVRNVRISEFAIFTDGLERLALRFAEKAVHAPFLVPLFGAIAGAEDVEKYFGLLRRFLESEKVNERTNDDKTLILATRLQGSGDAEPVS